MLNFERGKDTKEEFVEKNTDNVSFVPSESSIPTRVSGPRSQGIEKVRKDIEIKPEKGKSQRKKLQK
jgi:hypothetical protein